VQHKFDDCNCILGHKNVPIYLCYNSRVFWSILYIFVPQETGMNTLLLFKIYLAA